jgi:hypothetical protein
MRSTVGLTVVGVLVGLAIPAAAEAAILNGGFEDGFTGWETIGDSRVETSTFGSGSVEGTSQAFLSTAFNEVIGLDENGNENQGGNATCVYFISNFCEDSLEQFLNVSTFEGDTFLDSIATGLPIEGSAIKQTFTAQAGQMLSFSWNFLTNEAVGNNANPNFNDFAFAMLSFNSENLFFPLADSTSATFLANGSNSVFFEETGFKTFSYILPSDGEYTLGLGVVDVGETTVVSGLLVDKVAAVPEPSSTVGLLVLGALGTVSGLKRRWKKAKGSGE